MQLPQQRPWAAQSVQMLLLYCSLFCSAAATISIPDCSSAARGISSPWLGTCLCVTEERLSLFLLQQGEQTFPCNAGKSLLLRSG